MVAEQPFTLQKIEELVNNKVREDHYTEYKAAYDFEDTEEITIDVSSFANSSGGVVVYGVTESGSKDEGKLPEAIIPIKLGKRANHEWLEQIINSIEPRIVGLRIDPILVSPGEFIYVVRIPMSDTAHQAADRKYYRRYNFQKLAMHDQEIRDVMNRSKHPKVKANFIIKDGLLLVTLSNSGKVLARNVRCQYWIPKHWLDDNGLVLPTERFKEEGVHGYEYYFVDFTLPRVLHNDLSEKINWHVIAEKLKVRIEQLLAFGYGNKRESDGPSIKWKVYADNAGAVEGEVSFYECISRKSL